DLVTSLRASDHMAHELYLYFSKAFLDSGRSSLSYTATSRPTPFLSTLKFLNLHGQVNTQPDAQSRLNDALGRLVQGKVLASYEWVGEDDAPGLAVEKGPRQIENAV